MNLEWEELELPLKRELLEILGIPEECVRVLQVAGAEGKRSALTHSRVMIHQPLGGVQGQASDIEIEAKEIQKFKKELYTIISEHSHTPYDKVWKSQGADNLLDTELWEIPHSCGLKAQEKMLEFLDKNLK